MTPGELQDIYGFYWTRRNRWVEEWYKKCTQCATWETPPRHHQAPLQQDSAEWPLNKLSMNILGPLPETKQYNLVIRAHFTEWIEALPTLLLSFLIYLHKDQGRNFWSLLLSESKSARFEICKTLGITKTRTTPYHPQSNRFVERFYRT